MKTQTENIYPASYSEMRGKNKMEQTMTAENRTVEQQKIENALIRFQNKALTISEVQESIDVELDNYVNRKIAKLDLISRDKAFFIALYEDAEALTEEDIDVEEFERFLDQEGHQIEDVLKEAWQNWKEEQEGGRD